MHTINAALSSVISKLRSFRNEDRGATAVEYGLMVALIAAVIAGVVLTLGNTLHDKFNNVGQCIGTNAASGCTPASSGTP